MRQRTRSSCRNMHPGRITIATWRAISSAIAPTGQRANSTSTRRSCVKERRVGSSDQGTAAGFVGADLVSARSFFLAARRAITAAQAAEGSPLRNLLKLNDAPRWDELSSESAHNPIVRILLVAGRTQE